MADYVLIVDDSLTVRMNLRDGFRAAGHQTVECATIANARAAIANHLPGLVILDVLLPDGDGVEFLAALRSDEATSRLPVILLSTEAEVKDRIRGRTVGADDYLGKPYDVADVVARATALLPRRTMAGRVKLRVLLIDDSLTFREAMSSLLQDAGYQVLTASSGQEGLRRAADFRPNAIVVDGVMPEMDGPTVLRRIRLDPGLASTPCILLTASETAAVVGGINAGADDVVSKTENFDVLLARLRAQLRRKQFEDENRSVREQLFKKDAETDSARRIADARKILLDELSLKNETLSLHAIELQRLNSEMRTFADAVSHDLRQPLRSMAGFSEILVTEYGGVLDERGRHYLRRVQAGAQRMGELVDGLLVLSRVSRKTIDIRPVRLDMLAQRILARLRETEPHRVVDARIQPDIEVYADPSLMESVLENLLGNAWKFTSKRPDALVEVAAIVGETQLTCHVRDNGAGFDMTYVDKLFGAFQRLHSASEFEGTGIGLATAQRIVHRHGGRIWAESAPGRGATFSFTVPGVGGHHAGS